MAIFFQTLGTQSSLNFVSWEWLCCTLRVYHGMCHACTCWFSCACSIYSGVQCFLMYFICIKIIIDICTNIYSKRRWWIVKAVGIKICNWYTDPLPVIDCLDLPKVNDLGLLSNCFSYVWSRYMAYKGCSLII